jgi:hypothetical protein
MYGRFITSLLDGLCPLPLPNQSAKQDTFVDEAGGMANIFSI